MEVSLRHILHLALSVEVHPVIHVKDVEAQVIVRRVEEVERFTIMEA